MLDKIKGLILRWEDLQAQLGDPGVYGDPGRMRGINRELKELEPVARAGLAYQAALERQREAGELLRDAELRELAQEELNAARREAGRLEEELRRLLSPRDPHDKYR